MTRRRLTSKLWGRWVTTGFRGRTSTRVGLNLLKRRTRRRRRTYR